MDDDITFLNQCKLGTIQATVWETLEFDEYSNPSIRNGFLFQLTGETGSIQFGVSDIEDLLSVLKTTLECARDHAKESAVKAVDEVLAALCDGSMRYS